MRLPPPAHAPACFLGRFRVAPVPFSVSLRSCAKSHLHVTCCVDALGPRFYVGVRFSSCILRSHLGSRKHDHWSSFSHLQWPTEINLLTFPLQITWFIVIISRNNFPRRAPLNSITMSQSYSHERQNVGFKINLVFCVLKFDWEGDNWILSSLPSYQFPDRPLLANSNLSATKCVKFSVLHFVLFVNSERKLLADQQHLLSLFFKLMCILTNVPIKNGFVIYAVYF